MRVWVGRFQQFVIYKIIDNINPKSSVFINRLYIRGSVNVYKSEGSVLVLMWYQYFFCLSGIFFYCFKRNLRLSKSSGWAIIFIILRLVTGRIRCGLKYRRINRRPQTGAASAGGCWQPYQKKMAVLLWVMVTPFDSCATVATLGRWQFYQYVLPKNQEWSLSGRRWP